MMKMMMIKDRRDVRPLLVKFGVALALSFAGYVYSQIRNKRNRPPDTPFCPPASISDSERNVDQGKKLRIKGDSTDPYDKPCIRVRVDNSSTHASTSGRYNGDKDGLLLPEFDQLVKNFDAPTAPKTNVEAFEINSEVSKTIHCVERDEYEYEIENLKRRVKFLRDRERKLEVQLLEYYGLKEQEKAMMELQSRLKISKVEAKLFSMKIETLEAENKRLSAKLGDYSKVVTELEVAKAKIKQLKRNIRYEAEQNKEQILDLTHRVANLRDQEHEASTSDSDAHSELHRLTDLEVESEVLRKTNDYLQQENADLTRRLESTQFLANSLLEDPEKEELHKEMLHSREENENLTEQVERLQADRCADAEELVYLRWINACLRYELRNYQPPPGKTVARDLSKCLSPTSEKKAKQLILEYANTEDGDHKELSIVDFDNFDHWPSSQPSYLSDSTEHDDLPGHSSANKRHHKKIKFFAKLRSLIMGKHGHHHNQRGQASPIYRSYSVNDLGRKYSLDSPRGNSSYEAGNGASTILTSSSQSSKNSSLEYQPLSRLDEEDAKDIETSSTTTSNSRTSPGNVRFVFRSKSTSSSPPLGFRPEQELDDDQKELAKYAEVLRDSKWSHKKSASMI